jgi:hypothetical protein
MTLKEKESFFKYRIIKIVVDVPSAFVVPSVIDQLLRFGPDFLNFVKTVAIELRLSSMAILFQTTAFDITWSPGYHLVNRVAAEVEKFSSVEELVVVLALPEVLRGLMDEQQLVYGCPFHSLTSKGLIIMFTDPDSPKPGHISPDDLENYERIEQFRLSDEL